MPPAPSCSSHRHHRACGRAIIWPKEATYASLTEEHNILQTEELSQCTSSSDLGMSDRCPEVVGVALSFAGSVSGAGFGCTVFGCSCGEALWVRFWFLLRKRNQRQMRNIASQVKKNAPS